MRCLNINSVGGGVCSCYVVFVCPFCDRIEVSYVRRGVLISKEYNLSKKVGLR